MNRALETVHEPPRTARRFLGALLLACAACLALLPLDLESLASPEARGRSWTRLAEDRKSTRLNSITL